MQKNKKAFATSYFCSVRFLRTIDYYRLIQPNDLAILLQSAVDAGYNSDQLLIDCENSAIEVIRSYLSARFDLDRAFSDTPIFDPTVTYFGQSRVQYHEPVYDASLTYAIGARRSINNNIYQCSAVISTPEAFTLSHWSFVCLDFAIFNALIPNPEFQEFTNYPATSTVWFKDNYTYTSLKDTTGQSLNNAVYSEYGADRVGQQLPVLQDTSSSAYWTRNLIYSFTGNLPTDGTKWILGDNRNALMIQYIIDISLFNLFTIASPRNIPEVRIIRYQGRSAHDESCVIGFLNSISEGKISSTLPKKYPTQGLSFVWNSGTPKQTNTY